MNSKSFVFRINDNGEGLDIFRNVCLERGWIEYDEDTHDQTEWNVWWKSARFRVSDYDSLMPWQRLNHYPKATTITRKDCLARNLRRMKGVYGSSVYSFCPLSYNLPNDYTKFVAEYTKLKTKSDNKKLLWICKPTDMSRGRGIFIFKDLSELQYNCSAIVQRYIINPMLISGYKFDLRIYVAVPSFHPLQIYVHKQSIVRFSTEKYDLSCLNNVFSHLTNSSINKFSPNYTADKERVGPGCKWTLAQLRYYFHQNNVDDSLLWQKIINIITLTLITQSPLVPKVENCFELYGFDILLDENKKPWLIEVNFSPSLSADCQVDYIVKEPVLHDLMEMLNLKESDMDHGKSSSLLDKTHRHHRSFSRLGVVTRGGSKRVTRAPVNESGSCKPIFGLPLINHLEDAEGCFSASGDYPDDNLLYKLKREKSMDNIQREISTDRSARPPRTPRSRYGLRKTNSKSSGISDSGISSFSGNSDTSSGAVVRDGSDIRSAKIKSRQNDSLDKNSLCDLSSANVGNWRFMVRKQVAMADEIKGYIPDTDNLTSGSERPQQSTTQPSQKKQLSISNTRLLSPTCLHKRHSMINTKPWLQTSRSRLINQRQVGPKGPGKKYGDFYLVFPFNEGTLTASQTSLDARVIIREIQKQMKEIAATGGSPDRLWYPVRSIEESVRISINK